MSGNKTDLKRCPFCGANPITKLTKVQHDQLHGEPYQDTVIFCPKKHAQVIGATVEIAAEEWNNRHD